MALGSGGVKGITGRVPGQNNRKTKFTAQTQDLFDGPSIVNQFTHSAVGEKTEEFYRMTNDPFVNEAVDGQEGTDVVTGHELVEDAKDFQRINKTRRVLAEPPVSSSSSSSSSSSQ